MGTPIAENLGLVQSLVEVLPKAGAALVLLCSAAGWSCLPPDLPRRMGDNVAPLTAVSPDEELLVLRAYLKGAAWMTVMASRPLPRTARASCCIAAAATFADYFS